MLVVFQEYSLADVCMNCKCKENVNCTKIPILLTALLSHWGCHDALACVCLQTTRMHVSHIHTPSAQQVWHFAPNVIFQPISSIIALLISKPPQCLTGLVIEMETELSSHWETTCSFQPTQFPMAVFYLDFSLVDPTGFSC